METFLIYLVIATVCVGAGFTMGSVWMNEEKPTEDTKRLDYLERHGRTLACATIEGQLKWGITSLDRKVVATGDDVRTTIDAARDANV